LRLIRSRRRKTSLTWPTGLRPTRGRWIVRWTIQSRSAPDCKARGSDRKIAPGQNSPCFFQTSVRRKISPPARVGRTPVKGRRPTRSVHIRLGKTAIKCPVASLLEDRICPHAARTTETSARPHWPGRLTASRVSLSSRCKTSARLDDKAHHMRFAIRSAPRHKPRHKPRHSQYPAPRDLAGQPPFELPEAANPRSSSESVAHTKSSVCARAPKAHKPETPTAPAKANAAGPGGCAPAGHRPAKPKDPATGRQNQNPDHSHQ